MFFWSILNPAQKIKTFARILFDAFQLGENEMKIIFINHAQLTC